MSAPKELGIAISLAVLGLATTAAADGPRRAAPPVELKEATMIIEYNDSAEDVGVQFFLDSEGWREIEIFDPRGKEVFSAEAEGALMAQGGGTELFLESVEPPLSELPLAKFFRRFPEGTYKFRGIDTKGNRLVGEAEFTHDVPAGPEVLKPMPAPGAECEENVPVNDVIVEWEPVTEDVDGDPLTVVGYEVIVENDDLNFDVKFPAGLGTELHVPRELLLPGHEYIGEVLAVEESGNQTITEFCFTTAD